MMKNRGRTIVVNDGDNDNDGIPDYGDGFDLNSGLLQDNESVGAQFVPIVLELNQGMDFTAYQVRITYNASNPNHLGFASNGDETAFVLPTGSLRIWKKNGSEIRNKASLLNNEEGDFIDSGIYRADKLGFSETVNEVVLYIEAIKESSATSDLTVELAIDPVGTNTFVEADKIRITSARIEMRARNWNSNDWFVTGNSVASSVDGDPSEFLPGEFLSTPGAWQCMKPEFMTQEIIFLA